jgi:4-methyl-5(b-hydroxyethyl)-thiazole monophosphate biosynthesis
MTKHVLVPIADGTEEIEAVTVIDVLRRAGAEVTVASVDDLQVTAARGVRLVADCLIAPCLDKSYDLVVLPGGMPGAEHLRDSEPLKQILRRHSDSGRLVGAICAAPALVLEAHGLLEKRRVTCHPNHVKSLHDPSAAGERIRVDGTYVTSQGPGTAMDFALKLVEMLFGRAHMEAVAGPMIVRIMDGH